MLSQEKQEQLEALLRDLYRHYEGRILTLVDIAGLIEPQDKALKDMISQELWEEKNKIWKILWDYGIFTEDENRVVEMREPI